MCIARKMPPLNYDSGGVECLSGNQIPDAMGAEAIVTCLLKQVFKHATPLESKDQKNICAFYRHTTPPESGDPKTICAFYRHETALLRQPLCAFWSFPAKATR